MPLDNQGTGKRISQSAEAHTELIDIVQETLRVIIESDIVKEAASPTFFHPDFHTRNILVDPGDPTIITGKIDWQSAAIEPAFVFVAETPDFADELPEELPCGKTLEEDHTTETDELSSRAKLEADVDFCIKMWAVLLQLNPKYRNASALDPLLLNFLAAGSNGCLNDTVAIRSLLTDLGEKWEELGLPGQSIYRPSKDEKEELRHHIDEKMTLTDQLKNHLARQLGCDTDGWVPIDRGNEVLPLCQENYRRWIASSIENREDTEDEAAAIAKGNELWPYDQR